MFAGLTPEIARTAWELVLPGVLEAAERGIVNKRAGALVVLDPWSGEVLFSADVDADHPEAAAFAEFARAKAQVSWETGLSSRQVQQDAPHLYRPGRTKYPGSAVEHRLVVAFSGVQDAYDEAISWSVLRWIIALCQHGMVEVMAAPSPYLGEG